MNKIYLKNEDILLENSILKIELSTIDFSFDEIATRFIFELVKYGNELDVFKINCTKGFSELDGNFITAFNLDTKTEIILQRIIEIDGEISSELINLNKKSGQIKIIQNVGVYDLINYDMESNELTGVSLGGTFTFQLQEE